MFEIQENHVRKTVIVEVIALMANVSKLVKTIMTACIKINVGTKSACPRDVKYIEIVDRTTNALLIDVLLNVNIKKTVRMAKTVLMTIVPFHQVIICMIYFSIWHSLTCTITRRVIV